MNRRPAGRAAPDGFIQVRGARVHNLRDVDVALPRDEFVVITGVSGSGKSSLAFGTIFAEAQLRYLESVAPYARRLIQQVGAPDVREISGLPPAIALQQARGRARRAFHRRHGQHAVQLAADVAVPRRDVSARCAPAGLGFVLAEHAGRAHARTAMGWAGCTR